MKIDKCIEWARSICGSNSTTYRDLRSSIKFNLGDPCDGIKMIEFSNNDYCYPPFDLCAVEYGNNVVMVSKNQDTLAFLSFTVVKKNVSRCGFIIYLQLSETGRVNGYEVHDIMSAVSIDIEQEKGVKKLIQECLVITRIFSVLSQSKLIQTEVISSSKINRKRIKNGNLPLSSYKTLKLKAPVTYSKSEDKGGTHKSPRVHARRRHIRRLSSGLQIEIPPCIVGSKKNGMIHKDYLITG